MKLLNTYVLPAVACGCLSIFRIGAPQSERNFTSITTVHNHANQTRLHDGHAPADSGLTADSRLNWEAMRDRRLHKSFVLEAVRLDHAVTVDLQLQRFEVLSPNAELVVAGPNGERPMERPDVVLLRGDAVGLDHSLAFISITPNAINGFVRIGEEYHILSTGPHAGDFPLKISHLADLALHADHGDEDAEPFTCGTDSNDPKFAPYGMPEVFPISGLGQPMPCRVARIAIETDWEFTGNLFGGDTTASAGYALTLLAAVSEIYTNDLNIRLIASFLRVWEADVDPYDAGNTSQMLDQFLNYWRDNEDDVERDLAHLFSGDSLGGGVAYLGVLCSMDWGYAVSANLGGWFPYPLEDNHPQNWDLMVVAHEFGHNFGTGHTHDSYNPPLDNCGNGDCDGAENGTIMSYCHTCPGGMANVALNFHPEVVDQIQYYLTTTCDITAGETIAVDDLSIALTGQPAAINVLLNDMAASCEPDEVQLDTFDSTSAGGGTIEMIEPSEPGELLQLEYTPPDEFSGTDTFTYELVGGQAATVTVDVLELRPADVTGIVHTGAEVAYYDLQSPQSLPDFDALSPYAEDVVDLLDFPSTNGAFASSGLADEVGAVFTGYIEVPSDGLYIFSTDSDDGSALYIGDEQVVLNDGLHPMVEQFGSIALAAGLHEIRVEFFENLGGAGLIVRYEGPDTPRQVVPAAAWFHSAGCVADFGGDGVVGVADLLVMLEFWGCTDCPQDVNGDGEANAEDLLLLLGTWGSCQP